MKQEIKHWLDLDPEEQEQALAALDLPKYRGAQLTRQLLVRHELSPAAWSDIPKQLQEKLSVHFLPDLLRSVMEQVGDGGQSVKTLWQLADATRVESVLMSYGSRATLCVSSQVGCGMACPFCATGQGGLKRNLSSAEIVLQVVNAAKRVLTMPPDRRGKHPSRLSNVVFMGMGEPLANYSRVLAAIAMITGSMGISARNITVSTVGLVPQIARLAAEKIPLTLAISLHAPDDKLRDELCPINTRWPVAEVLKAGHDYFEKTGRRISIEYALIRDINDQGWRADMLADLLNDFGHGWVHVNLIGLNPTPGSKWTASRPKDEVEFLRRLEMRRVPVTMRESRGQDIDAACGQLAAKE